jgi:hypothetical protein
MTGGLPLLNRELGAFRGGPRVARVGAGARQGVSKLLVARRVL